MSTAIDRERERRDDVCPACGEDIDWGEGDHELAYDERAYCPVERTTFDVAVLDLAHLRD